MENNNINRVFFYIISQICLLWIISLSYIHFKISEATDRVIKEVYEIKEQQSKIDTVTINSIKKDLIISELVTLTVYNPVASQCDDTPLVTANGTKIDLEKLKKDEIKYCAVSRNLLKDFPYGSKIYIKGHGEYEVVDTMNKRFVNYVDILQDISKPIFKKKNIKISLVN